MFLSHAVNRLSARSGITLMPAPLPALPLADNPLA